MAVVPLHRDVDKALDHKVRKFIIYFGSVAMRAPADLDKEIAIQIIILVFWYKT